MELSNVQEIALRLLAGQRDLVNCNNDTQAEIIARALNAAELFLAISQETEE